MLPSEPKQNLVHSVYTGFNIEIWEARRQARCGNRTLKVRFSAYYQ
jgi:hypothetical protein